MADGKEDSLAVILNRGGVTTPWYDGWDINEEKREWYRDIAKKAQAAKLRAHSDPSATPVHEINVPNLRPETLMPILPASGLNYLSLFSGGGGLDLGFERAGYDHVASFEILDKVANNLALNRPSWKVHGGEAGDVTKQDWRQYAAKVDVMHGGPPCQPFSMAGKQRGSEDMRDMIPEYVRAIQTVKPAAFVLENVPALLSRKFEEYVGREILTPLADGYHVQVFELEAARFGVPQVRRRVIFVGFRSEKHSKRFVQPLPTHRLPNSGPVQLHLSLLPTPDALQLCMGAREALGLPDIGYDDLAPTIRSGLTGPRHTTSVLSSRAAQERWAALQIWPNGVSLTREKAQMFPAENGHFRLSVQDCAVLQGFTEDWHFPAPAYLAIGQIGNSVCPPMAYQIATAVRQALLG
jgi:DNA (cytosine-5)-methyltransferase 1